KSRNMPAINFCSPYYKTELLLLAYAESIYPVLTDETFGGLEASYTLLPPTSRRQSGRPRKCRIPSSGEVQNMRICSRCKQRGHNRQTCKKPIPLHPIPNNIEI